MSQIPQDDIFRRRRPERISNLPDISGSLGIVGDVSSTVDDFLFDSGEMTRQARKSTNSLNTLDSLFRDGKISDKERAEKAEPFRQQLGKIAGIQADRTAQVQNGEFLVAAEQDAGITADGARTRMDDAGKALTEIDSRITQVEGGENPNLNELARLQSERAVAEDALQTARAGILDADSAFATARANRLASMGPQGAAGARGEVGDIHGEFAEISARLAANRTPEEQAIFDAARAAASGEPIGATADPNRRLTRGEIAEEIRPQGDTRKKGPGFLGPLKRPDGFISTELSISLEVDGREIEIPAIVSTSTQAELDLLLSGGEITQAIVDKALAHARARMAEGKSPFFKEGETPVDAREAALDAEFKAAQEAAGKPLPDPTPELVAESNKRALVGRTRAGDVITVSAVGARPGRAKKTFWRDDANRFWMGQDGIPFFTDDAFNSAFTIDADAGRTGEVAIPAVSEARARKRANLARIASEARERREAGIEPSEKQKREIRIKGRAAIKAAKTHAEKRELAADMRKALKGERTQLEQDKEAIDSFVDGIESLGLPRTKELEEQDAKFNTDLNTRLKAIKRRLLTAGRAEAKKLVKEFNRVKGKLEKTLTAQSKVLEKREAADIKKAKVTADRLEKARQLSEKAHELSIERLADANESKDRDRIEAAAKEERAANAKLKADKKKVAAAEKAKTTTAAEAAEVKVRADAALRLEGVDLKALDEQVKAAELKVTRATTALNKQRTVDPRGLTESFQTAEEALATAVTAVSGLQTQRTALRRRISEIKTRAKIVNGGFAPSPTLPPERGKKIPDNIIDEYLLFYGDENVARKVAIRDGWVL